MTMTTGVGLSTNASLSGAVTEAVEAARRTCPEPSLLLLLVMHTYGLEAIDEGVAALKAAAPPGATLAGGTVNGLAIGNERHDALHQARAVAVVAIGGVPAAAALSSSPIADPLSAGRALSNEIESRLGQKAQVGLLFTPGFSAKERVVDPALIEAIAAASPGVRLAGTGLTGGFDIDGSSLPGYAFLGDRKELLGALLIAFGPGVSGAFGIDNGARPLGRRAKVTASQGPVLLSLDDRPARDGVLDLLASDDPVAREHFSRNPMVACVEHGRGLAIRDERDEFYWPNIPAVFLEGGVTPTFYASPPGTELGAIQITAESGLEASRLTGRQLGPGEHDLVLSFSCGIRGFTLGPRAVEENDALLSTTRCRAHLTVIANGEIGCRPGGPIRSTAWAFSSVGLSAARGG